MKIWDLKHLKQEIKTVDIDQAAGVIMPFFDADTNLLYLAGKVRALPLSFPPSLLPFHNADTTLHYPSVKIHLQCVDLPI